MQMDPQTHAHRSGNIFLRMHPVVRIVVSFLTAAAVAVFLAIRGKGFGSVLCITTVWDVFAFTLILMSWIVFFKRKHTEIYRIANEEDGSRVFVLLIVLIATVASMVAVFLLMTSTSEKNTHQILALPVSIAGMILSWTMIHTIFTFHYAHMYYGGRGKEKATGLDFPNEKKPDYLDFAYFSFVIGMTFQVSDVVISSTKIRRTVLSHSLLAFVLNTFVVALTINQIAGLKADSKDTQSNIHKDTVAVSKTKVAGINYFNPGNIAISN